MARNLNLQVRLAAIDKATRPIRAIMQGSEGMARQLKASRDALKGLQGQQRDISSFRSLKAASEQTSTAMQASRDRVRQLSQQMAATAAPTKAMTAEFQRAVREAQKLKEKHGEQQRELQGLRGKLSQAGISTRNLGQHERDLRQRISQTNQVMGQQEKRLKRLATQQRSLANAKASYEKSQSLAGSMAATGAGGVAAGSGILYAGAKMAAPGLEFDTTMSKVQALTRLDKGDEQLAALRKQARELGATTMFSAGDAASGMAFLAMAGFTPEAIRDAMPGLLDMAKAGDMELGLTADIASNILGGFRLEASQMGNVADILTKAFTTSNMSLESLGETMKYMGPVASTAGMGLEEAAAMAGLLGNVGIQSSNAGTTLRAMLLRLAAPAGPAAKAMAQLGISAKDSQGNVRGITEVLGEVAKATEKMGSSDRLANLKAIFGEEPAAGMAELINQAGAGGILKYLDVIKDHQGAAAQTAKVMGDNMAGDLDELSSGWDDVQIEVFEQMNGTLRELTQTMTSVVGRIGAWTRENPELVKQIIKTVIGLGILMAAGGGITLMLASILGPLAMVRYGMTLLGIRGLGLGSTLLNLGRVALPLVGKGIMLIGRALLMNPIGLAVTAIAGAAYLIYKNWDSVGPYFAGLWAEIKEGFSGGLGGILATLVNFSPVGLFYRAFAGVMNYFGFELPGKFTEFGGMLIDGLVNGITGALGGVKDAIVGAGSSAIGWFKETLGIHSPSRVFSELGGYTMEGLNQGLQRGENGPLSTLGTFGKNLAAAGAFSLAASSPLMADDRPIAFDNRPPLAAQASAPSVQVAGDTITIQIHAAPGMDENALARAVAAELDKRERAKAARARSSMYDQE